MQTTRFDELVEFPCVFTFKVMGVAVPDLPDKIVEVVQLHAPGDYSPKVKPSSKGSYHSVSIQIQVHSQTHIETLYQALAAIDEVRYVL
jgi:putative lipoic acid-binding regulatory protein